MNDADHDLARQNAIDSGEYFERLREVSLALNDALKCFGPSPDIVVTEERVEAWDAVLKEYGLLICPNCDAPSNGGICKGCAGVTE